MKLALRFLAAVPDQLVGKAETLGNLRVAAAYTRKNHVAPLEHKSIVLGSRDEHIACSDAELPPQRRRHDEPSLRPDRHLDRLSICHNYVNYATLC